MIAGIGAAVIALTMLTGGIDSHYHEALYVVMFAFALVPSKWQVWHAALMSRSGLRTWWLLIFWAPTRL